MQLPQVEKMTYIAHANSAGDTQSCVDHLHATAELAEKFAQSFDGGPEAYNAGLLHDIGKYSQPFQERIRGGKNKVDHSTFGAQEALKLGKLREAVVIAGHHTGIPDVGSKYDLDSAPTLFGRMKRQVPDASAYRSEINPEELKPGQKKLDSVLAESFYIRMLFSSQVDADYLNTSNFMTERSTECEYDSIHTLHCRLMSFLEGKGWLSPSSTSPLAEIRSGILRECLEKGRTFKKGIHKLTVPTGGGKTVSSLAYALEMADRLKMDRVIYVIPYTSIIDQTAMVFEDILGAENVLEHHSGVEYNIDDDCDDEQKQIVRRKMLATENWDAPVVVTTSVQFFESLFSNLPSSCRKLHNIANSVVIFDEAQNLPEDYLRPCVYAISNLVKNCNCEAVLCTATQPVLDKILRHKDFMGENFTSSEIISDTGSLYDSLQRTTLVNAGTLSDQEVVGKMLSSDQSLCVVNARATAQQIYESLPKGSSYCLTTLLCPSHRKRIIAEIRDRLQRGETCRVVSTSLIEAGIDLDFKLAMRELTGLDSVLQTAGRCNREGKRSREDSVVYVFEFMDRGRGMPKSIRRKADVSRNVLLHNDPSSFETVEKYFSMYQKLSGEQSMDKKEILPCLKNGINGKAYPFSTVSTMFKLIEDDQVDVYIPYQEGERELIPLRSGAISKSLMRKANQYRVGIPQNQFDKLVEAGAILQVDDQLNILENMSFYRDDVGLMC